MPEVFVAGTLPNRLGADFTTTTGLLTLIRDNLITAGWTATLDQISTNNKLIMRGLSGAHNCWIRFIVANNGGVPNGKILQISGDHTGGEVTVSPNLSLLFIETAQNRLWLTADADAGCIAIQGFDQTFRGAYFGFQERIEPTTDQWAWGVGFLNVNLNEKYVARSAFNNTNWRQYSDDFLNSTNYASASQNGAWQGIWDRRTVAVGRESTYTNNVGNNAGFNPQNGAVNALNNRPYLDSFYLVEGRGSVSNYTSPGNSQPQPLYCRGNIKYAVVGLASVVAGSQYSANDGKIYLSVGGQGWQGFRIA